MAVVCGDDLILLDLSLSGLGQYFAMPLLFLGNLPGIMGVLIGTPHGVFICHRCHSVAICPPSIRLRFRFSPPQHQPCTSQVPSDYPHTFYHSSPLLILLHNHPPRLPPSHSSQSMPTATPLSTTPPRLLSSSMTIHLALPCMPMTTQ